LSAYTVSPFGPTPIFVMPTPVSPDASYLAAAAASLNTKMRPSFRNSL
jgi:hypothetical protein